MEEAVQRNVSLLEISDGYERRTSPRGDLDQRYHKIGISAVAAAVRYQGETKPAATIRTGEQATTKSKA
jgi:hypothetical protein